MKPISTAIACFAILISGGACLLGQEVTAGIYGTVQDASGAVVPGATITMNNVETGRKHQTVADQTGNFTLTLIPFGNYDVTAEAAGFKKNTVKGLALRVNDNRKIVF